MWAGDIDRMFVSLVPPGYDGSDTPLPAAVEGWVELTGMPARFVVAAGVLVEVIEGCDKSLATCDARFANVANFRGEPYLPGVDLLTRYPGG